MNRFFFLSLLCGSLTCASLLSQTPCVDGFAGIYPCDQVDLMSQLGPTEVGGGEMNDIWGWTDPLDGKEYALLGRTTGTAFIDVSDPVNPVYLGNLPTHTVSSLWRDIKVFDNHAFIVSEASGHGMQVFDLTQLRNVANPPATFTSDAHFAGFGGAHNIAINEATGRGYVIGANTFSGGLNILDLNNPLNPTLIGSFAEDGSSHDVQVVNYIGPDAQYAGKEMAFCFNENAVTIVDVTNAGDPLLISSEGYSTSSYTHQGWLTEDHKYLLVGDELDEGAINTRTYIFDVQDLDNPVLIGTHVGTTPAIDHNLYTHNGYAYQSNYRAGLQILDLANVGQGQLEQAAFFDVYPASNSAQFNGSWSNYPYFESGIVIVSHIEDGLFVVQPNIAPPCLEDCGCTDATACNYDSNALNDDGTCDFSCYGCTDANACNHDPTATLDDGTCQAPDPQFGCDCSISGSLVATLSGSETSAPSEVDGIANPAASTLDVSVNFTGSGGSWVGDMAMTVTDGSGNCIAFGGYDDTPPGCPTLGNYQTIWPSSWAASGDGVYTATVDLSSAGLDGDGTWKVAAFNGWSTASAVTYDVSWTLSDVCPDFVEPDILGCTDPEATNYNPAATLDDGSCVFPAPCPGDFDGNGIIAVNDVLIALGNFGCAVDCTADLDGDGVVGVTDILNMLSQFGQPCD